MKINMSRAERGSENGVTIKVYGPGVVDIAESLAQAFIDMGIASVADDNAPHGPHGSEMKAPQPLEVNGPAVEHPRQKRKYTKRGG